MIQQCGHGQHNGQSSSTKLKQSDDEQGEINIRILPHHILFGINDRIIIMILNWMRKLFIASKS